MTSFQSFQQFQRLPLLFVHLQGQKIADHNLGKAIAESDHQKEELKKELKDKNFKEAYESFNEEFALAKDIIKLRKTNHLTQKELALKV